MSRRLTAADDEGDPRRQAGRHADRSRAARRAGTAASRWSAGRPRWTTSSPRPRRRIYASGPVAAGTLYQYVTETDGSVSTYQYDGVVFKLAGAGQWKGDQSVKQKLDFFASRRRARLMTPAPSPSARIVAAASDQRSVTDAAGRTLQLRRMDALDRLRAVQGGGADARPERILVGDGVARVLGHGDRRGSRARPLLTSSRSRASCPVSEMRASPPWRKRLNAEPAAAGLAEARTQAGKLSRHPDLIDCLFLVRNGGAIRRRVQPSPRRERLACVVILGTLDGRAFDWASMTWTN